MIAFSRRRQTTPQQMEDEMKPLSQQLAELSVRAKSVEDAFAAAQKETHEQDQRA